MIYKDKKVTLYSALCKHYESNNKDFYNILDDIVESFKKLFFINSFIFNLH